MRRISQCAQDKNSFLFPRRAKPAFFFSCISRITWSNKSGIPYPLPPSSKVSDGGCDPILLIFAGDSPHVVLTHTKSLEYQEANFTAKEIHRNNLCCNIPLNYIAYNEHAWIPIASIFFQRCLQNLSDNGP